MKKFLAFLTLISLTFSGLVLGATPASATVAADDATLSTVNVGGYNYFNGGFRSDRLEYDIYSSQGVVNWDVAATNSAATIRITSPSGAITDGTGTAAVDLTYAPAASQLTTIRVTSEDGTKTSTYKFYVSSKVMYQPELVSLSDTKFSNGGNTYITVQVKHAAYGDPWNCYTDFRYEYLDFDGNLRYQGLSRNNGYATADGTFFFVLRVSEPYDKFDLTGKVPLILKNHCDAFLENGGWYSAESSTRINDALTAFEASVTSNDIPAQITFHDVFDLKGPGIGNWGQYNVYMLEPVSGSRVGLDAQWYMGEGWGRYRLGGHWDDSVWSTSKPVDIVMEHYDYAESHDPIVVFKKRVTFVPFAPKNVSVSPAKGPIAGGNVIKVRGVNLCNWFRESYAQLLIDGKEAATDWGRMNCTWSASDGYHFDGIDTAYYTVPAATKAGQVTMTLNIGYGANAISTKYTYGAKPTLTAVSPSTVANTGGSIITLTGTDFGLSGNPTVTIDGIKAPWVQRVSSTKILAMVPANANRTGAVDLNVISSSGGGALDQPGTITLAAATSNPVVTSVTPGSAGLAGGDTITIKGTGFVAGSTGVTIGNYVAPIISSSATELQVELPSGDGASVQDVVVGTPTGIATKAAAFTYLPNPGVSSITPWSIASTTPAANSKVTIVGVGFGTQGTIKVGSKAPVAYTATANGTTISNVAIPNGTAGQVAIVITPKGSTKSYNGTVVITGPTITNFSDNSDWRGAGIISSNLPSRVVSAPAGGGVYRIDGTGFGTSGKVKVGTLLVTPTTYTDTAITFVMPARTAGIYDITVVPSVGSAVAVASRALGVNAGTPTLSITKIESAVDNTRGAPRYTFDPQVDTSDLFVITGTKLNGTDGTKTRVYVNGDGSPAIVPVSVTATSLTFRLPRDLNPVNWYSITVVTNVEKTMQTLGVSYVGTPPPVNNVVQPALDSYKGLCLKTATAGRTPAVFNAVGTGIYGASGTVSFDGETLPAGAVTWTDSSVTVNLANQSANLANPWGSKTVVFTPSDSSLVPRTFYFNCAVDASVSTTLGGSTSSLTIAAGSNYTASGAFTNPLPNTTFTAATDGYVWQTAEDFQLGAWTRNVHSGLPVAAGDYYVRVNIGAGTYDRDKYATVTNSNEVHLTITGTPVTFTPKLRANNGDSITYKGQLGDGTGGSTNDIMYTNTTVANAITGVTWQYRNHACAVSNPSTGWYSGLPKDVAINWAGCGGDDTSVTSWEIRVASFEMLSGGVDRSIYYVPTYNTFLLTINKKSVTATGVKVEKVYDGTNAATLGEIALTGAVEGDVVTLNPSSSVGATYSDATAGAGKAITLAAPLVLSDAWKNNYVLANPNVAITGKILKADAKLKLTPSVGSVVISNSQTVNVTVETTDTRTGLAPDAQALVSDAVVTSKTPGKCTYVNGVVTAVSAGDCIIEARQAASTNYNASLSWHDDTTTVEAITIKIYPAPKTLSVVADDVTVSFGEGYSASAVVTGLLDGDNLDGFTFEYYQGTTLLNAAPTEVGTYRIVVSGGNLTAADSQAYSNVFKYVAGKLVITPAPPVLTAISPNHGPEAGGNTVVITGTGLDTVTSVVIGGITLRKPKFTVNGTGTEITFKAPAGTGVVELILRAGTASVAGEYIYDEPPVVTTPFGINIDVLPIAGSKLAGQKVTITGGGLKPNSAYNLTIGSSKVSLFKGTTDSNGSFSKVVTLPAKSCVAAGKQTLTLSGVKTDDTDATDTAVVVIDNNCSVAAVADKTETKTWTLSGFLFNYLRFDLTSGGTDSLNKLVPLIKGAKTVTIYGYTQTDATSEATKKANLELAANRCKTVMSFLKSKGIKAVYKTVAKGGVDPVSLTDQSKNRRVVIEATY